eukprot:m.123421 g.123421  ORF g.123421 m.123421 type:complete len:74 (-) comp22015_c0_seq1:919-1140(-)
MLHIAGHSTVTLIRADPIATIVPHCAGATRYGTQTLLSMHGLLLGVDPQVTVGAIVVGSGETEARRKRRQKQQ